MRIHHLRQKDYCIIELGLIQYAVVSLLFELLAARLLEGRIEDLQPKLVGDHVALHGEHNELGERHVAILQREKRVNMGLDKHYLHHRTCFDTGFEVWPPPSS